MRKFLQVFYFIITALSALAFVLSGVLLVVMALEGSDPSLLTNRLVLCTFIGAIVFFFSFNTYNCLEDKDK